METGFKDPIKDVPTKKMKSQWNYEQPVYDQRSSCFINAGTCHGVGHAQPVGLHKARNSGVIPSGRVNTLEVSDTSTKPYPIEMNE